MKITVFTPTYNRAYILPKLYQSLVNQTYKSFEWLLVDDGSTDETETLIANYINEKRLTIRYYKQPNGGKHRAINKGVTLATGVLFFIVDSDDFLTNDAIEKVNLYYDSIFENENLAGVSFRRGYNQNEYIGSKKTFKDTILSIFDFRFKMKIQGDQAEAYKTSILKKYPFPEFENEKFCAEGLIWNRIGKQYEMLWTSHIIYICNYLQDGLTSKIVKLRMQSFKASMLYYSELENCKIPSFQKLKANINFWRFSFNSKIMFLNKIKAVRLHYSLIGFPLGFLMFLNDIKSK